MAYMVVEAYKKKSKSITEFFVALPGWLDGQNKIIYYPRIHSKEELQKESSTYASDWIPRILKKVWHTSLTIDHAESMVDFHITNNSGASSEEACEADNVMTRIKKNLMPAPKSLPRTKKYSLMMPKVEPSDSSLSTPPSPTKIMKMSEQSEDTTKIKDVEHEIETNEMYDDKQPVCIGEHEFDKESGRVLSGEFVGYFIQTTADGTTIMVAPNNEMESQSRSETEPVFPPQQEHPQNQHAPDINVPDEIQINSDDFITIPRNEFREIANTVVNMQSQINETIGKIDAQAEAISKIYAVTKNINSFLTQYFKDGKTSEAAGPSTKQPVENVVPSDQFEDLEAIEPFKITNDLLNFEQLLANKTFADRYIRYLKCKYNFASLKAKTLFGLVLRQLTAAELFTNYSWKGNSRKGEQNIGFATKHEQFVKFITIVVRMVDEHVSNSDVEEWFSSRLRQKKQIAEREKNRTTEPKLPAPRIRLPKDTGKKSGHGKISDDDNGQGKEDNQGQEIQNSE